jgi:tRNA (mo5U34)-methyltransferase
MNQLADLPRADLLGMVPELQWAHSIDVGDGVVTPGQWGAPNPLIVRAIDDVDFRGKKVLDIGCWGSLWSFMAEDRGAAEIYSTDDLSQRPLTQYPTFDLARRLRGSKAKYFGDVDVLDVSRLGVADFDVVLYCGIYYHLKDPLLAFARLRQVMKEGAILIVSGVVIGSAGVFARFYYHEDFANDPTNWWVPTAPCLRQWVECSFFEILTQHQTSPSVCALTARAVRRKDPHYERPDRELAAFDLNVYG